MTRTTSTATATGSRVTFRPIADLRKAESEALRLDVVAHHLRAGKTFRSMTKRVRKAERHREAAKKLSRPGAP